MKEITLYKNLGDRQLLFVNQEVRLAVWRSSLLDSDDAEVTRQSLLSYTVI